MSALGFPGVSDMLPDEREHRRQIATVLNRINRGKINATIDVTLNAGSATTTLTESRLGPNTHLSFMPQTANAATAKPSLYITSRTKGTAIINHASSAATDQTFTCLIIG